MRESHSHVASLIQRLGGVELPAPGRWTLHRSSFVGISNGRHRSQVAVSDGLLTIADPPEGSSIEILTAQSERSIRLTASMEAIREDPDGFSCWQLRGAVEDGVSRHPVDLTLTYHGVRRRGDRAWAWLTGRAATPRPQNRVWRRPPALSMVLDLLFDAPAFDGAARTRGEAEAAIQVHPTAELIAAGRPSLA
jgi:hypothetical protein